MNRTFFVIVMSVYMITLGAIAQSAAGAKCPNLKDGDIQDTWQLRNPAVNCRAQCKKNSDCTSVKDKCGRLIFVNKIYKDETQSLTSSANYQCSNHFSAFDQPESVCERQKCEPAFKSCEVQIKNQDDFLKKNVLTECSTDADCTFILAPNEKCIRKIPAGRTSDLTKFTLDMTYLRDAIISSCKMKTVKECASGENAYCISKECLMFVEKPPYKNFVNLEGPKYLPNYSSGTTPLKMPRAADSKCVQDSDCSEATGICSQYVVSLNKKYLASFKSDVEKMEKSIACPAASKLQIPKSRCFKEFCSFVN